MRGQGRIVAAVSLGGVIGATLRYALESLWPSDFPWATLTINVTGCAAMGTLMVLITEVLPSQKYVRPFLGTGVLGGYTTFSTYTSEGIALVDAGRPLAGFGYLVATPLLAVSAAFVAAAVTTRVIKRRFR